MPNAFRVYQALTSKVAQSSLSCNNTSNQSFANNVPFCVCVFDEMFRNANDEFASIILHSNGCLLVFSCWMRQCLTKWNFFLYLICAFGFLCCCCSWQSRKQCKLNIIENNISSLYLVRCSIELDAIACGFAHHIRFDISMSHTNWHIGFRFNKQNKIIIFHSPLC